MVLKYLKIAELTCETCGAFADYVEIEMVKQARDPAPTFFGVRFLCKDCKEKTEGED